jgi:hypothetical protein
MEKQGESFAGVVEFFKNTGYPTFSVMFDVIAKQALEIERKTAAGLPVHERERRFLQIADAFSGALSDVPWLAKY